MFQPGSITRPRLFALAAGLVSAAAIPHSSGAADGPARFDDHSLVRIEVRSARELQALFAMSAIPWSCRVGPGSPEFVISPEQRAKLDELHKEHAGGWPHHPGHP